MRILWVSEVHPDPNSGAGGTELLMVEELRRLGHDVQTIWADALPRRIAHGNLHYAFELPKTYANAIRSASRWADFDIITVNLGQGYLAARQLRSRHFQGAFIQRSHGLDDHLDETLDRWQRQLNLPQRAAWKRLPGRLLTRITHDHLRRAAKECDGYVVSNSLDARFLQTRHGLSPSQICCIPQAPADPFVRLPAKPMTANRVVRLLYVAGFHYAKGPHAVAAAARTLLQRDNTLTFTWVCHAHDHDKVRVLIGDDCCDRLRLLGWMPQEALVKEFDQHGIFIYPSLFDGFGKVFLEAMARGLCVIGTRAGGMVDIIRDGENGFLCECNAADEIANRVMELQTNAMLARQISEAAAATAAEHTWQRVGRELADFFSARLESANANDAVYTT